MALILSTCMDTTSGSFLPTEANMDWAATVRMLVVEVLLSHPSQIFETRLGRILLVSREEDMLSFAFGLIIPEYGCYIVIFCFIRQVGWQWGFRLEGLKTTVMLTLR